MVKNRLKQIRTAAGLTQRQAAERAGLPVPTYEKAEQGAFLPRAGRRRALAQALDAPEYTLWPQLDARRAAPPPGLPTAARLRRSAEVAVGDKMVCRMPTSGETIPCTVVQTGPHWFRVRWDRSGVSECWSYHALLRGEMAGEHITRMGGGTDARAHARGRG